MCWRLSYRGGEEVGCHGDCDDVDGRGGDDVDVIQHLLRRQLLMR